MGVGSRMRSWGSDPGSGDWIRFRIRRLGQIQDQELEVRSRIGSWGSGPGSGIGSGIQDQEIGSDPRIRSWGSDSGSGTGGQIQDGELRVESKIKSWEWDPESGDWIRSRIRSSGQIQDQILGVAALLSPDVTWEQPPLRDNLRVTLW